MDSKESSDNISARQGEEERERDEAGGPEGVADCGSEMENNTTMTASTTVASISATPTGANAQELNFVAAPEPGNYI